MTFSISESELIEFAKRVELTATKVLDGLHRSPRGGQGIEFHSSIPYAQGEDTRFIDWKRYAGSDRFYVNRYEKEAKASWTLLLDGSASMSYENKSLSMRYFAASVAFLSKVWGDQVSLFPHAPESFDETMKNLASNEAGVQNLKNFSYASHKDSRILFFSDFFWKWEELEPLLEDLQLHYKEVHLFQILHPNELDFPFEKVTEFLDLESTDRLILDSRSVKERYLKELHQLQAKLKEKATSFQVIRSEGESFDKPLMEFFEGLWNF